MIVTTLTQRLRRRVPESRSQQRDINARASQMMWSTRQVSGVLAMAIILTGSPAPIEAHAQAPGPKGDWEVVDPKTCGLDVQAIQAHRDLCERSGADCCLVVYKGKIVSEWYGPNYKLPMHTMSSMK